MSRTNVVRRIVAGLGAAVALTAVTAPAAAYAPDIQFGVSANDALVTPGGPQKFVMLLGSSIEKGLSQSRDWTVTIDRTAVSAFAQVDLNPGNGDVSCVTKGSVVTCTLTTTGARGMVYLLGLDVRAKAGATAGRTGELAFTVSAPGVQTATTRSTVTVGEGVDLAAGGDQSLTGRPGARVSTPASVANVGSTTARGAVLFFIGATYPMQWAEMHRNCFYFDDDLIPNTFACTFDDVIEPGAKMTVDSALAVDIPAATWAPSTQYALVSWWTPADWQEFLKVVQPVGGEGPGEPLKLNPAGTVRAGVPQTDLDSSNNEAVIEVSVRGNQKADLAATGATVAGAVGDTVTAKLGYTNNGPATAAPNGIDVPYTGLTVTVPKGTTAVRVPEECWTVDPEEPQPGRPGAAAYLCDGPEVLHKGRGVAFEFGLRIDQATVTPGRAALAHRLEAKTVKDLNPANDVADIVVTASGGDGTGGGLPVTGASTGLVAGAGAVLLAAGAAGFLLARRRRTRFEA